MEKKKQKRITKAKRVVTAPKKRTAKKAEPLARRTQAIAPVAFPRDARERTVVVQTTVEPPISPYVVRFSFDAELPVSVASEVIAPTLAEELASEQALREWTFETPNAPQKKNSTQPRFAVLAGMMHGIGKVMKTPFFAMVAFFAHSARGLGSLLVGTKKKVVLQREPRVQYRRATSRSLFAFQTFGTLFLPSASAVRATVCFALIAVVFVLPATGLSAYASLDEARTAIWDQSSEAVATLARGNHDSAQLPVTFLAAHEQFSEASTSLKNAVGMFDTILPLVPRAGATYASGKHLLEAGTDITRAGEVLTSGMNAFTNAVDPLTTRLIHLDEALSTATPLLMAASLALDQVSKDRLPGEVQAPFQKLHELVAVAATSVSQTAALLPNLETFLGVDRTMRYLVVFQNPNELRPTGGFIGSYATIDIDRGVPRIVELPGGGSYDLSCCMSQHVVAPGPLHLIAPNWQFRDANWFPDFPTSAQKLAWFYEKSGGGTVDGVIAVNAPVVADLLGVVGPMTVPEYHETFTKENFVLELQRMVELAHAPGDTTPKRIIGQLAPELIARLEHSAPETLLRAMQVLGRAALSHDVQVYSNDPEVESAFDVAGLAGALPVTSGDSFAFERANIAGSKTSSLVETHIGDDIIISSDGTIIHNVTLTRTHQGKRGDPLGGVRNVEYVRFYVPKGSVLLSADGFTAPSSSLFKTPDSDYQPDLDLTRITNQVNTDVKSGTTTDEEFGRTVFGNWAMIDPGETQTITLQYRLPQPLFVKDVSTGARMVSYLGLPTYTPYSLVVTKQSGSSVDLHTTVHTPSSVKIQWSTGIEVHEKTAITAGPLNADRFIALLFER